MIYLRRFVIPFSLLLWGTSETNSFGFQPDEFSRNYSGIKVKIVTPITIPLGRDIPVQITLSNTSNAMARVLPLDKARLMFTADVTLPNLSSFKSNLGELGGDLSIRQGPGPMAIVRTAIVPLGLPAGKQLKLNLNLGEVIDGRYLRPGKYRLHLQYDDRLMADASFEITFDPNRDLERVIELFEHGVSGTGVRTFAADMLADMTYNLGRDRMLFELSSEDTPKKIKSDVDKIRNWWAQNRTSLRLEKGRFVKISGPSTSIP